MSLHRLDGRRQRTAERAQIQGHRRPDSAPSSGPSTRSALREPPGLKFTMEQCQADVVLGDARARGWISSGLSQPNRELVRGRAPARRQARCSCIHALRTLHERLAAKYGEKGARGMITIIDAMSDPEVFGLWFDGSYSWLGVARNPQGRPRPADDPPRRARNSSAELVRRSSAAAAPCPGTVPIVAGRRAGKDSIASLLLRPSPRRSSRAHVGLLRVRASRPWVQRLRRRPRPALESSSATSRRCSTGTSTSAAW